MTLTSTPPREGVRVVLAPSSPMLATGLAPVLAARPDIAEVAIAATIDQLAAAVRGTESVVVLDAAGLDAVDPVRLAAGLDRCPHTRSIVLAGEAREELHQELLAAGSAGTFPLQRSAEELAHAIAAVARGTRLGYDAHHLTPTAERRALARGLSRRELDVLELLCEGLSNRAIGARLYLSVHTARHHVQSVLEKLGAHSRVEAAAIAQRDGLVRRDR